MGDCQKQVRLDAYHDGELSPAERADVEAHLRGCPSCAAKLAAMRDVSGVFSETPPREPSPEQLLQLAWSVRADEPASDARILLRLFRTTAIAASLLLACALAAGAYLSQRAKAAAHEAMVLDHMASGSRFGALATDPAQWIADDLRGRQEER